MWGGRGEFPGEICWGGKFLGASNNNVTTSLHHSARRVDAATTRHHGSMRIVASNLWGEACARVRVHAVVMAGGHSDGRMWRFCF